MKICIVIKRFTTAENIGGAETFAYRFAKACIEEGLSVEILSARHDKPCKDGENIAAALPHSQQYMRVRRLAYPNLRFIRSFIYGINLFIRLLRNSREYDAIFVTFASLDASVAAAAGIFTSVPVICKVACSGENGDIGILKRRYFSRPFFRMFKLIDSFIALNSEVVDDLHSIGIESKRIRAVPNGVDTMHFKPRSGKANILAKKELGIDSGKIVIIAAGRLSRQKDYPTLLRALFLLNNVHDNFEAFILGKGSAKETLENYIANLGLANNVRICSASDIKKYLDASDVFVLSSRWEGLSNALLEAMSSGLACICSDIPGNNTVIDDCKNGILFPVNDHVKLACALDLLISEPGTMKALGLEARKTIEKRYDISQITQEYISLFRSFSDNSDLDRKTRKEEDSPAPPLDEKQREKLICR